MVTRRLRLALLLSVTGPPGVDVVARHPAGSTAYGKPCLVVALPYSRCLHWAACRLRAWLALRLTCLCHRRPLAGIVGSTCPLPGSSAIPGRFRAPAGLPRPSCCSAALPLNFVSRSGPSRVVWSRASAMWPSLGTPNLSAWLSVAALLVTLSGGMVTPLAWRTDRLSCG